MKFLFAATLLACAYGAEPRHGSQSPLLQGAKDDVKVNASAALKAGASTGAKMVQDAYAAIDEPGMNPPQEMALFSSEFPNGNICGEDKNPKHGSCAHSCNTCKAAFHDCHKAYKSCLKSGTWELQLLAKKATKGIDWEGVSCLETTSGSNNVQCENGNAPLSQEVRTKCCDCNEYKWAGLGGSLECATQFPSDATSQTADSFASCSECCSGSRGGTCINPSAQG